MRDESPFSAFPFAHGMKLRQADEHHIFCCIPIFCSLATDRKKELVLLNRCDGQCVLYNELMDT